MTVRFFSLRAFPAAFTVVRPTMIFDLYPLANVVAPKSREEDLEDVPEAGKRFAAARRSDLNKIEKQGAKLRAVQAYLASISYADEQLGRVLDALESSEYNADTVIVFGRIMVGIWVKSSIGTNRHFGRGHTDPINHRYTANKTGCVQPVGEPVGFVSDADGIVRDLR